MWSSTAVRSPLGYRCVIGTAMLTATVRDERAMGERPNSRDWFRWTLNVDCPAFDGTLDIYSPLGVPTTIYMEVPCEL